MLAKATIILSRRGKIDFDFYMHKQVKCDFTYKQKDKLSAHFGQQAGGL
jgi:hypothetical protein